MSKPIVSTDVGDVPLYVHNRENGYVVPVGDSAQLADRVLQLLREPSLRTKFGIEVLTPGVTGWAQINGRDLLSIEDKVEMDKYYLFNKSIKNTKI